MQIFVLLGRILFSSIFILSSYKHLLPSTIKFGADSGVPFSHILVPLSGVIAFLGGLSILLGYKAKLGAWLLVLFLIPVTYQMHQFWAISNPATAAIQQVMFMKNLALLGGAFIITYFGSGPLSLEGS